MKNRTIFMLAIIAVSAAAITGAVASPNGLPCQTPGQRCYVTPAPVPVASKTTMMGPACGNTGQRCYM